MIDEVQRAASEERFRIVAPLLVRVPVNSFEFYTCVRTPQAEYLLR